MDRIHFFPETKMTGVFSTDEYAHQMKFENILFSKDFVSSLGGVFPLFNLDVFGTTAQGSLGSSVHFEVRPNGQAHVVSTDFYVDYLILDFDLRNNYYLQFVTGHTSHHLSDNWFERLQLTKAVHYSRDYVECSLIYSVPNDISLTARINYGYKFHLEGKENKRWMFLFAGEKEFWHFSETIRAYAGFDLKLREEANFTSSNAYQLGIKMPMRTNHLLRIAYQYRHGLDERGQFFPQHISRHTIGLYIEV